MKKETLKSLIPYAVALGTILLFLFIYFQPLFQGKQVQQGDVVNYKGAVKEIQDYRDKTGDEPLWTNSMFGGMPAYQISVYYPNNLFLYVDKALTLGLPHPANLVFLYFLGFFFLLRVLKVDPWLCIGGAMAFALSSYFFIILEAGHNTKAHAIGYMAPVLASMIIAYRGKYLLGGLLMAISLGLELYCNHLQITYYLIFILLAYGIAELVQQIKEKSYKRFLKATGVLAIGAILAVGPNIANILTTYSYTDYTTRGPSELTSNQDNKTKGLDRDYITGWSYGIPETWSLLIPNVQGGGTGPISENKSALKSIDPQFRQAIGQNNHYWGDQPFTSGPVYAGAIIIFLFILGAFVVPAKWKWPLLGLTALSIMLAWGRHFMGFTDFFLDFVPGYNKFRTVSMILVIAELAIPLLAILALQKIIENKEAMVKNLKWLYISFGISGGLALIFWIMPSTFFDFFSAAETTQFDELRAQGSDIQQIDLFMSNLEAARIAIFKADAIRSFLWVLLGAAIIWVYIRYKMSKYLLVACISLLVIVDMSDVNLRYLSKEDFVSKRKMEKPFQASVADNAILEDKSPGYRVLNLAANTFNDASTSYFHRSIGGYHGAKLKRYQELIDFQIDPELQLIYTTFKNNPTDSSISALFPQLHALNMLNAKYIIFNPDAPPLTNPNALGAAWLVADYKLVENPDMEIAALRTTDPAITALVDKRFADQLNNKTFTPDSLGGIVLMDYQPNKLVYNSNSSTEQIAVFSEIFYSDGWKAFLNGNEVPYFRANYVLRAMVLPAGKNTIEFRFEPTQYYRGESISLIGSILIILLAGGVVFFEVRQCRKTKCVTEKAA